VRSLAGIAGRGRTKVLRVLKEGIVRVAFVDDSKPYGRRSGMGRLIALGAVVFPEHAIAEYASEAEAIYTDLDVPLDAELKWSPPDGSFLKSPEGNEVRGVLVKRTLQLAVETGAGSVVVVWDTGRTTLQGQPAEQRVLKFLYERVSMCLESDIGLMIADKPAGGRVSDDEKWLASTLELTDYGTEYIDPDHIILPIVTAPSHHLRQLQLADLVTGATAAAVAGGNQYADQLAPLLLALAHKNRFDLAGGAGLKLFPDELRNLHYWAFREDRFVSIDADQEWQLPNPEWAYASDDGLSDRPGAPPNG
jgi:hypothetical protein